MEATRFAFGKELLEIAKHRDDFVVCIVHVKLFGKLMSDVSPAATQFAADRNC